MGPRYGLVTTFLIASLGCGGSSGGPHYTPPCYAACGCGSCPPLEDATIDDAAAYPDFDAALVSETSGTDGRSDGDLDAASPPDGTAESNSTCAPLTAPVHCMQGHCIDEPPIACVDGGWLCLTGSASCYEDGGAAD